MTAPESNSSTGNEESGHEVADHKVADHEVADHEVAGHEEADVSTIESSVAQALMHYAELQEDGGPINRQDFLSLYPNIRDELGECLGKLDQLHDFAAVISQLRMADSYASLFLSTNTVLGDYEILRPVGQGGMGVVYEVRQLSGDRRLALKVLHAGLATDQRAQARFRNEIEAAALLDHPHIVNVLDVGVHEGIHFYTMRFIDGQSLAELKNNVARSTADGLLARSVTLQSLAALKSTREASCGARLSSTSADTQATDRVQPLSHQYYRAIAEMGMQAAEALHYAHQQGIVHRDIKPSNLLLDDDGHVWITDFGLARIENSNTLTLTGDLLGTLRFMSPEQLNTDRKLVDHRSDIYSLGATLYEISTLTPLIRGSQRPAILHEVLEGSVKLPSTLHANFPRDLETILLKAIAKDPQDRYASCQALADDLRRFVQQLAIQARRPSLGMRVWRWTQRNPQLAKLTALFTFLAMLGVVTSAWSINEARYESQRERSQRETQQSLAEAAAANLALHANVSESIIAFQAWKRPDYQLLRQITARWSDDPSHQSFERKLLSHIASYKPTVLNKQTGECYCIRLSRDESMLLCGGAAGMTVLERATGRVLANLKEHQSDVNGVAWSDDGTYIASVGDDGKLKIYERQVAESGHLSWRRTKSFQVDGTLVHVEFVPNSEQIVACERPTQKHGPNPRNALHVWSLADEREHHTLTGPESDTEGLAVSKDGRLAAVASRDQHVYVWDLKDRQLRHRLPVRGNGPYDVLVTSVAFAHKSNLLVLGSRDGSIQLFDAESGSFVQSLASLVEPIETVAFAPDDDRISLGTREGLTRIYEKNVVARWIPTCEYMHEQGLWSQTFSSDGTLFMCGRLGNIECVDCNLPMERRRIDVSTNNLDALEHEAPLTASQASNWQPHRDYERKSMWLNLRQSSFTNRVIHALDISPDDKSFAYVSEDCRLAIGHLPTGEIQHTCDLDGNVGTSLAFSASGHLLAVLSRTNRVLLFDARSLRRIADPASIPDATWSSLAFYPENDYLLVTMSPYSVRPAKASSILGFEIPSMVASDARIPKTLRGDLRHALYSSDALTAYVMQQADKTDQSAKTLSFESILGQAPDRVVTAQSGQQFVCLCSDNTIRIVRLNQHKQPLIIHAGNYPCSEVAVSPDGSLIAVATTDTSPIGTVRFFHTATGRELFTLPHYLSHLTRLRFTHDGQRLVAAGAGIRGNAEIVIWGE